MVQSAEKAVGAWATWGPMHPAALLAHHMPRYLDSESEGNCRAPEMQTSQARSVTWNSDNESIWQTLTSENKGGRKEGFSASDALNLDRRFEACED